MTGRINNLIDQSDFGSYAEIPDTYIVHKNDLVEFAELIVRECADLLETNGNSQHSIETVEPESHSKSPQWREGYQEAVTQYSGFLLKKNAKLIKQHFGVDN